MYVYKTKQWHVDICSTTHKVINDTYLTPWLDIGIQGLRRCQIGLRICHWMLIPHDYGL